MKRRRVRNMRLPCDQCHGSRVIGRDRCDKCDGRGEVLVPMIEHQPWRWKLWALVVLVVLFVLFYFIR